MKKQLIGVLVFVLGAIFSGVIYAQTILTVASATGDSVKAFSLQELHEFDQITVKTSNEFVDGEKVFQGPLIRDILERCRALGALHVVFTAANDYQVEVNVNEFKKYDAILALSMDGELLSRRDKGPIWVIYPMSDHVELRDPVYNSRLIWQLVKLEYR